MAPSFFEFFVRGSIDPLACCYCCSIVIVVSTRKGTHIKKRSYFLSYGLRKRRVFNSMYEGGKFYYKNVYMTLYSVLCTFI